jgi:hypothetical protein
MLSRQARGYGIAFLAAAMMVAGGGLAISTGRRRHLVVFGAAGLLGMLTLPIFVVPFCVAAAALLLERRLWVPTIATMAVVGVIALAYLHSILSSILTASHQQFGAVLPDDAFARGWVDDLLAPSWRYLIPGADDAAGRSHVWASVATYLVAALGMRRLWVRKDRSVAVLLGAPVVVTYLVVTLLGLWTVPRFTSFLLVPALAVMALGIVEGFDLVTTVAMARRPGWVGVVVPRAALLGAAVVAGVTVVRFVNFAELTDATPYENYKDAAAVADAAPGRVVLSNREVWGTIGLNYYLRKQLVLLDPDQLRQLFCQGSPPMVYLEYYAAARADTSCLHARGATLVSAAQDRVPLQVRGMEGLGPSMDVWILPSDSSALAGRSASAASP